MANLTGHYQNLEDFETEVRYLINGLNLDHLTNTPDYIVARYLRDCIQSYAYAHNSSVKWKDEERVDG